MLTWEAQGRFACLKGATAELGALVRSLTIDCTLLGHPRDAEEVLVQLTGFTHTGLAAEATALLDGLPAGSRAGRAQGAPEATLTRNRWPESDTMGFAELLH